MSDGLKRVMTLTDLAIDLLIAPWQLVVINIPIGHKPLFLVDSYRNSVDLLITYPRSRQMSTNMKRH